MLCGDEKHVGPPLMTQKQHISIAVSDSAVLCKMHSHKGRKLISLFVLLQTPLFAKFRLWGGKEKGALGTLYRDYRFRVAIKAIRRRMNI